MLLTPRRSAVTLATLAFALAPAAQAQAGLLDGLLVGGATTPATTTPSPAQVTALVTQLLPTAPALPGTDLTTAVTNLLAGGVPGNLGTLQEVLPDLSAALTGGSATGLVEELLSQGLPTASIVPLVDQLLTGVADPSATVTAVVGQLLGAGLPTDATALSGVLAALQGGALPTGSLLSPVAGVLDTLAQNDALPAEVRATIAGLSTSVRSAAGGVVGTDVLTQVGGLLGTVGGALGTSSPVKDALSGLAGLLPPRTSTTTTRPTTTTTTIPVATPVAAAAPKRAAVNLEDVTATVSQLKLDRARKVLKAKVACPKKAFVPCTVKAAASVDGLRSGRAAKTTLQAGASKVVAFKLPTTKTKKLGRRGGRLTVKATTTYAGYRLGTATKNLKVARRR